MKVSLLPGFEYQVLSDCEPSGEILLLIHEDLYFVRGAF